MTNTEITKLYQDRQFQKKLKILCRKYFDSNMAAWRQGTGKYGPAFEQEDLESMAWERLLDPKLRPGTDEEENPIHNYLIKVIENHFKDLLRIALARFENLPETDYGEAHVKVSGQIGPGQYVKLDRILYGKPGLTS